MPSTPATAPSCPCGSQQPLAQCCLPYIQGIKQLPTAEALLRARYTAFTRGDVDYILDTHHSRTRHDVKREEIEEWSKTSIWKGLQIERRQQGGPGDEQGILEFCATYASAGEPGKDQEHWEQSLFEREDGAWRFVDARSLKAEPIRRTEPKVGRNDPCACGSGKKFKKCHGLAS